MKNLLKCMVLIMTSILVFPQLISAQGGIPAYYKIDSIKGNLSQVERKIIMALEMNEFEIIGSYNPARSKKMKIIAFSNKELTDIALNISDRGIMASVLRIGIKEINDTITEAIVLNPDYLFYGYMRDDIVDYELQLSSISNNLKISLHKVAGRLFPLGKDSWSENELKVYRFLVSYPGFDEPIILHEFATFEQGLATIKANLQARRGNTIMVYERIFTDKQIAIFGVGLLDPNSGETEFLNILGDENIPALPYEIVLQGNKATMLNGKFRFPFYWSNSSVQTIKSIRRIPSDIEFVMQNLTK